MGGRLRILWVDPVYAATGYGVVEVQGTQLQVVDYGVIRTSSKDPLHAKLLAIHDGLREIVRKMRPKVIAVETLFTAHNVKAALLLGQARGAVLLAVSADSVEIVEYSPLEVKKAVVGYGRASKEQVQAMVSRLLEIEPPLTSPHVADGLAVALCHAHSSPLVADRAGTASQIGSTRDVKVVPGGAC